MTNEQRAAVGKYAAEHSNIVAVRHFAGIFEKPLSESTVHSLKDNYMYLEALHRKCKATDVGDEGVDVHITCL